MDDRPRKTAPVGLSLVIPAYNEEAGIRQAVAEADEALSRLVDDYEVLVVDDGSRDGTAAAVSEEAAVRPRVRLISLGENRGYGAALRTGFLAARCDLVAFTDADCQFHLADLGPLAALTEHYPVAVGFRHDRQDSWPRRMVSRGYNLLARTLLGTRVRDCDCALKVFRREALARLLPESSGFFVNTEMLARARMQGFRVGELGVRHRPRLQGESKVSLWDVPRTLKTLLPFWWTRVWFAGGPGHSGAVGQARKGLAAFDLGLVLLVLVAALLFFSGLRSPLLESEEARHAEIPREMLESGQFLVPVLHGRPYLEKPPLMYWLVMGGYRLLGVHDWVARLVPNGAAFLTVLVAYGWGRRSLGRRAGLLGALMLCLSARYVYLGRTLTTDSLLAFWVAVAWAGGHRALTGPASRRSWWWFSAAACGLGLLTGGLGAALLVVPPLLGFQVLDARSLRPGWRLWLGFGAVALGLSAPWYAGAALREPALLAEYFRQLGTPAEQGEASWYHLSGLFLGMCPWALLLPALAKFLTRRSVVTAERRPAGLGFLVLTFGWGLALVLVAADQRAGAILPVFPPLALALGCCLDTSLPSNLWRRLGASAARHRGRLAFRATLLVLAVGTGAGLAALFENLVVPAYGFALAGCCLAGFAWLWRQGPARREAVAWGLCGASTFVLLLAGVQLLLPGYARKNSLRAQVRPHRELSAEAGVAVVCYPQLWDSVSFYLRRSDVRTFTPSDRARLLLELRHRPSTLVFVKSDHHLQDLVRSLPASLEFVPQGRHEFVTVGLVRRAEVASTNLYARR